MSEEICLAVTSSTALVGVAIARSGKILASEEIVTDRRHAEELTPMLERTLSSSGVSMPELTRLAVDIGPGRFTGLRVGLATVRSLALALDLGIVGVTSLELLATGTGSPTVVASIDARRAEVFQQRFVAGESSEPVVGTPEELAKFIEPGDVVVGDGGDRYPEVYGSALVLGQAPSAEVLALIGLERDPVAGPLVEPLYLRGADVQINIKTRYNT